MYYDDIPVTISVEVAGTATTYREMTSQTQAGQGLHNTNTSEEHAVNTKERHIRIWSLLLSPSYVVTCYIELIL